MRVRGIGCEEEDASTTLMRGLLSLENLKNKNIKNSRLLCCFHRKVGVLTCSNGPQDRGEINKYKTVKSIILKGILLIVPLDTRIQNNTYYNLAKDGVNFRREGRAGSYNS